MYIPAQSGSRVEWDRAIRGADDLGARFLMG